VQFYTSGTTGLPKGAELTNANFAFMMPIWTRSGCCGQVRPPCLPADVPYRRRGLGHRRTVRGRHNYVTREFVPAEILSLIQRSVCRCCCWCRQ